MDTQELGAGDGEHPQGIVLSELLLVRERQLLDHLQGPDVLGCDPRLIQGAPVEGHVLVGMGNRVLETRQLQLQQLLPGGAFLGVEGGRVRGEVAQFSGSFRRRHVRRTAAGSGPETLPPPAG